MFSQEMAEEMKRARLAEVEAMTEKYSDGKFQPPMERNTLKSLLPERKPSMVARKASSLGSTLIS